MRVQSGPTQAEENATDEVESRAVIVDTDRYVTRLHTRNTDHLVARERPAARRNAPDPAVAVTRPTSQAHSSVAGGAVVSASRDEYGRPHVRVNIDGIPDSRLNDGAVPLDISVGDAEVFAPISDDDGRADEL